MELAQIFHGIIGLLFIAMIIGHIYIGTIGMEGAIEAMVDGTVDYNWAKEHHSLWVEEELKRQPQGTGRPVATRRVGRLAELRNARLRGRAFLFVRTDDRGRATARVGG